MKETTKWRHAKGRGEQGQLHNLEWGRQETWWSRLWHPGDDDAADTHDCDNDHGCYSQRFLKFPDFFLANLKFPWPTEITISQISRDNGLNPSLTAILPTHLFMLSASHMQCIWIYSFLKRMQKGLKGLKPSIGLSFNFMSNVLPIQQDSCL